MLTRLYLRRFKNFLDATLLMGPLTLLVGTNASGKSNLRDAFRFLHGVARGYNLAEIIGEKWGEGGVLQWRGIRGGTREAAFAGAGTFTIEVDFDMDQKMGSYGIEVAVGDTGKPPRVIREQLKVRHKHPLDEYLSELFPGPQHNTYETVFDSHPPYDQLQTADDDPDHLPVRLQSGDGRRGRGMRLNCLSLRPALCQIAENPKVRPASVRENARTALRALKSMRFLDLDPESLRKPSLPGQTVLGDKGENLSSVLQDICNKPELKSALASWVSELTPMDAVDFDFPSDQTGRILVSLIDRSGRSISAYSASDGTLRFLAMVAALLGTEASRFYFFEELDNGIHPARLHLLLDLIERHVEQGSTQMVATTHSPELLGLLSRQSMEKASLVYRLPQSSEGKIIRILDIPGAREIISKQDLARLHASGWLEDAVFLSSGEEDPAVP